MLWRVHLGELEVRWGVPSAYEAFEVVTGLDKLLELLMAWAASAPSCIHHATRVTRAPQASDTEFQPSELSPLTQPLTAQQQQHHQQQRRRQWQQEEVMVDESHLSPSCGLKTHGNRLVSWLRTGAMYRGASFPAIVSCGRAILHLR